MKALTGAVLLSATTLAAIATPTLADMERGKALYENHCAECHDTQVHLRYGRLATTREELRIWVLSWSLHAGLGWDETDVEDVTRYLSVDVYDFTSED